MIGTDTPSPQRFLAATFLALAAGCSGGGGSSPGDAAPIIVTASFNGASSTPATGEQLLLVFSKDIVVATGALLTDEDVTLSSGATLGTITQPVGTPSTNTITITLGAGVTFIPGDTTIVLAATNDVVRDVGGELGTGGTAVVIGTSDGSAPTLTNITIANIDGEMNGTGPAGGTLQVPANGWAIDLSYLDNSSIATAQTQITANVAVGTASGTQSVGTNLVPFLTEVSASNTAASYLVPSTTTFPNGPLTLTFLIVDASGLASTPGTFGATVRAFTDALRPFETSVNASQVWVIDFARDLESFATSAISGGFAVDVTNGSNGTSDFEDLLRLLGLTSATPIANVSGTDDSNVVVINRIKANLLAELAAYYSGANVTFQLTQPAGTFNGSTSVNYNSIGYSIMSIGGASTSAGVLGLAIFDPFNATQNDNSDTDFQSQRLGVFLHTIVNAGMGPPASSNFRMTYDVFTTVQGGTPIGDDGDDGNRLNGSNTDSRATAIDTALTNLARFLATVTAHECGHSVGLVVNGAMPTGLYGNDSSNFPGSADGHIRNTSLFPTASTNVMSPSLSYTTATSSSSAFNTLNLAYLREQILYNGN